MSDKIDLIKGTSQVVGHYSTPTNEDVSQAGIFIGEALGDDEKINSLMSTTKPEITILVGFVGYGKTSFVASCYHRVLTEGKIGDYTFYDSDTLTGLERRLYLRRVCDEYESVIPQTQRTIRGAPHLLTFRFSHPQNGDKVVVMSDHSGEDYEDYINVKNKLRNDILLKNADRILFFVDCEKLINNERLTMQRKYLQLIKNMIEMSSFKENVKIQFLFNKFDLIAGKEESYKKQRESFLKKMADELGTLEIGQCYEVVSKLTDKKYIEKMFLEIIENTISENNKDDNFSGLDWVKNILK